MFLYALILLLVLILFCFVTFVTLKDPAILNQITSLNGLEYIKEPTQSETEMKEGMAPLGWGSYKPDYAYGVCDPGSFERSSCEIGNCPLGTTVSNERYCGIVHAQDSDPKERTENIKRCIDMMKYCD